MAHGNTRRRSAAALLTATLAAVALAGCGGSSGNATQLLHKTFSGAHRVSSGRLFVNLSVQPSGSSTLKGPLSLSFGGPFQSLGAGKLPQSNFNLSLNALGHAISMGILSTGTKGYVSFGGASYPLPQAEFQKLESSFSSLATSAGSSHGSGTLSKLGIQPLHWLSDPQVVGDESVDGTATTHIRAKINVSALLADFNTFLSRASSLGISGASSFPHGISQTTINRISGEVQNPSFDLWTGKSDHTIRRLRIGLTLPVSGQISTLLGGLRSAAIALQMEYADLNQPQSISAPTNVQPFSQFQSRLQSLVGSATGALSGAGAGGGSGSSGSNSSSTLNAYTQCIQAAGSDVGKMQQCASLLSPSGK